MRERIIARARVILGFNVICTRCGATYGNYAEECEANLGDQCPGARRIADAMAQAEREE
jgi:ribosomal protein L40E